MLLRTKSMGLTLVELMIAMLLGTSVMLISIEVMFNSARVAALQDGLAEINENGKFVLGFLRREFQLAGFSGAVHQPSIDPIDWSRTKDDGGQFDTVTLRRKMFGSGDYDCLGDGKKSDTDDLVVLSRYYVDKMPGQESVFELRCELLVEGKSSTASVKRTALVAGIESFQIQFGVVAESEKPDNWTPQYYLTAKEIDHTVHRVVTVRFGLLLHNTQGYPLGARWVKTDAIRLLEKYYGDESREIDLNDGRIRRTFETMVELKNVRRETSI